MDPQGRGWAPLGTYSTKHAELAPNWTASGGAPHHDLAMLVSASCCFGSAEQGRGRAVVWGVTTRAGVHSGGHIQWCNVCVWGGGGGAPQTRRARAVQAFIVGCLMIQRGCGKFWDAFQYAPAPAPAPALAEVARG